jgi:hypothetical protein
MSKSFRDKPEARKQVIEDKTERGAHRKMDPYKRSMFKKNFYDIEEYA